MVHTQSGYSLRHLSGQLAGGFEIVLIHPPPEAQLPDEARRGLVAASDIVALGHVNAEAIELLRAVFPYVEWDKEVRGLGDTRLQQQLDAAAATIISERVDFDEDADVRCSSDWRYCFSYWVGCYVYDYKRFPPAHRIASFKRFAHTFGARMTIKVLDRLYENEQIMANPEIFPRVALQWSKGGIFPIVECKTKDWVNESKRSPSIEKFTFKQVDNLWDEMQKNLLAMFEKGELSM